ncbi:hypothetical protein HMPREF0004_0793 [Achromobacter piechaudii ATCC 43553]|uniref:Uncharacterized protein n=1 Tax=Achromobacter piechaudii ATCC 43553 TaxID=742159 RepID=D4X5P6_9BURK|nr:hypothetical protein HMPREF0004_0793 [Achromobacter piechaudii ATCC 43553]
MMTTGERIHLIGGWRVRAWEGAGLELKARYAGRVFFWLEIINARY